VYAVPPRAQPAQAEPLESASVAVATTISSLRKRAFEEHEPVISDLSFTVILLDQ
jgi:hypothetical protein